MMKTKTKQTAHLPLAGLSVRIVLAAFAAIAGQPCASSADPPQYEVWIFDLPSYVTSFYAWGINDKAQVAGAYYINYSGVAKPFFWEKGQFIPLELPPEHIQAKCHEINAAGQIVGTMGGRVAPVRGFIYENGAYTDLGVVQDGNWTEGMAINSYARITGYSGHNNYGEWRAFLWEEGVLNDLHADFPNSDSRGLDINDHGWITGYMRADGQQDETAFIWDQGQVEDLGPVPGGSSSRGIAINNRGDVAGQGSGRGFYYRDGEMVDIGLVPGSDRCHVTDMNNSGEVVGYCEEYPNGPGRWAFVWRSGTMYVLEDCVPPELNLELKSTYGINNAGQITATGQMGLDAARVLLTPINPRPADVNRDGAVDIDDLFEVLGDWGPCPDEPQVCPADVNNDGAANLRDILALIVDWG